MQEPITIEKIKAMQYPTRQDMRDAIWWLIEKLEKTDKQSIPSPGSISRQTDTDRLDWLSNNASKFGIVPDWEGAINLESPDKYDEIEYTDIRKRIDQKMFG